MIVRLSKGFWIDATDGLNWTLYKPLKNPTPKKQGTVVGHYPNLRDALDAALKVAVHADPTDGTLARVERAIADLAGEIMAGVTVEVKTDPQLGRVARYGLR